MQSDPIDGRRIVPPAFFTRSELLDDLSRHVRAIGGCENLRVLVEEWLADD